MTDNKTPQAQVIEKLIVLLDTSKLRDFSDEDLSISDIVTALNSAYEAGHERASAEHRAEPKSFVREGDGVVLTHRNGSKIVGTITREGGVSHPSGYDTLTELGQKGWMLHDIVAASEFAGREFMGY